MVFACSAVMPSSTIAGASPTSMVWPPGITRRAITSAAAHRCAAKRVLPSGGPVVVVILGRFDHAGRQLPGAAERAADARVVVVEPVAQDRSVVGILEHAGDQHAFLHAALEQHQLADVVEQAREEAVFGLHAQHLRQQPRRRRRGERAPADGVDARLEAAHAVHRRVRHHHQHDVADGVEADAHDGVAHAEDRHARREHRGVRDRDDLRADERIARQRPLHGVGVGGRAGAQRQRLGGDVGQRAAQRLGVGDDRVGVVIDANERGVGDATVFVERAAAAAVVPLRVVVADDGSAGMTPVARPPRRDEGSAGITPVARAGGRLFGDGVAVSPVRTVLIVTVERPFALAGIRFERKLGR